jgi:hypothetical protein
MKLRDWQEPVRYYLTRGDRVIRRPHEDFKPIELTRQPTSTDTNTACVDELLNSYINAVFDGLKNP